MSASDYPTVPPGAALRASYS